MAEEPDAVSPDGGDLAVITEEEAVEVEVVDELGASPTARPISRGSISPSRKTISRLGSAASHLTRPRTAASLHPADPAEGDDTDADANSDTGYDTDLEIEADKIEFDTTGKETYIDACRQYGVIPVSYFIRHMQEQELVMRHHGLGPAGAKAISVPLVSNTKILRLDLSDNWLNPMGGVAIADMLKENCYITELVLSDNHLQTEGAVALCNTLQENVTITHVTLSGNDFDDVTAAPLAEIITSTQRLEELDLSHNNFADRAGELLGNAIAENTSLKMIDLSWNHFRRAGAVHLARGIGANIFLKTIDISWNGMAVEGAEALGDALLSNNVLEELIVNNNRIPTEGAVKLSKGLFSNETLRILDVGRNPMHSAGGFGILNALRQNTGSSIEKLDFSSIVVNKDFVELETEVKELHPKLVLIYGGVETEKVKPKPRMDPMAKIRQYVEENNLRMVDLFNQFDRDHDMTVTREEFQIGVEQAGIKLTNEEMAQLMDVLDKDGDGDINYSELVIGNLEFMAREKSRKNSSSPEES